MTGFTHLSVLGKRPPEDSHPSTPPIPAELREIDALVGKVAHSILPSSPKKQKVDTPPPSLRSTTVYPPNTAPTPRAEQSTRPKPNFDSLSSSITITSPAPPPTPRRVSSSEMESPFKKVYDMLESGYLEHNGSWYEVKKLGQGTFSSAYILKPGQHPLVASVNNSDVVIKAFHGTKTGFSENYLRKLRTHSYHNYLDVKRVGLPVAEIYFNNIYAIQKKISGRINPLDADQLAQIKMFFTLSVKNNIIMDLQPANLRAENGRVALIDFMEDSDEILKPFLGMVLRAWYRCFHKIEARRSQLKPLDLASSTPTKQSKQLQLEALDLASKPQQKPIDHARNQVQYLASGFLNQNRVFTTAWFEAFQF